MRSNPNPYLIDFAVQIAWEFLEKTGEIEEPCSCLRFLKDSISLMARNGVNSRLLLSNRAIAAYQHFKAARIIHFSPEKTCQ